MSLIKYNKKIIINIFLLVTCINTYAGVLNDDNAAINFIVTELDVKSFSRKDLTKVKKHIKYSNITTHVCNLLYQHISSNNYKHNANYYNYRCKKLGGENHLIQQIALTWAYMQYFDNKKNSKKSPMITKFDVQEVLKRLLEKLIRDLHKNLENRINKVNDLNNDSDEQTLFELNKNDKKTIARNKKNLFRCVREKCTISEIADICNHILSAENLSSTELEDIFAKGQILSVKYDNNGAYHTISQIAFNIGIFANPWCLQTKKHKTAMHIAAQLNKVILGMIIEKSKQHNDKFSEDLETEKGVTPCLLGVRQRHVESIKCLLDKGANIHKPYVKSGYSTTYTPYTLASKLFKRDTYALELLQFNNMNVKVKITFKKLLKVMTSLNNKFQSSQTTKLLNTLNKGIPTSVFVTPKETFAILKIEEILTRFLKMKPQQKKLFAEEITEIQEILLNIQELSNNPGMSNNRFYLN